MVQGSRFWILNLEPKTLNPYKNGKFKGNP